MKKFISIIIAIIILNNASVCYAAGWYESTQGYLPSGPTAGDGVRSFNAFEDFEQKPLSHSNVLTSLTPKNSSGGYIDIEDHAIDGKSLVLGIQEGNVSDCYASTYTLKITESVLLSFDLCIPDLSTGSFLACFKNVTDAVDYQFITINANGVVTYANADTALQVKKNVSAGEKINVSVLYDSVSGAITFFHNKQKVATLTESIASSRIDATGGFIFRFRAANTTKMKEYKTYMDNLSITRMNHPDSYIGESGYLVNDGSGYNTMCVPVINLDAEAKSYLTILAQKQDSTLQSVDKNDMQLGAFEYKTAEFSYQPNISNGAEMFVWKDATVLKPMSPVVECDLLYQHNVYEYNVFTKDVSTIESLYNTNSKGIHPRILFTASQMNNLVANSDASKIAIFTARVDSLYMKKGLQSDGTDDGYFNYDVVGGRLLTVSRRVKSALIDLSLAYRLTGRNEYLNKAWEILNKVCTSTTYPDWHPSHLIDTTELSSGVAISYDWLYQDLTSYQRNLIEQAMLRNAVAVAESGYTTASSWTKDSSNRGIVNNGGFLITALALADIIPDRAFAIISNALSGMEYSVRSFAPDGAWEEGAGYIAYTLEYLAKTFGSLESALGSDMGLKNVQGLSGVPYFTYYVVGSYYRYNFHDDGATAPLSFSELLYLDKLFQDDNALKLYDMEYIRSKRKPEYGDFLWHYKNTDDLTASVPLDAYFRDVEFVSMRDNGVIGETKSYLAFHGGRTYPDLAHHHCDCGHFDFDLLGERWAVDLGSDPLAYNLFSGDENEFTGSAKDLYRERAEGHNCLVINPSEYIGQVNGSEAKVVSHYSDVGYSYAALDMTQAYSETDYCLREYELCNNRTEVVITDTLDLKQDSSVYWFMHTKAECTLDGNDVILTQNEKQIRMHVDTQTDFTVDIVPAEPMDTSPQYAGQADNSLYRKIRIRLNANGAIKLQVRFTPEI